MGKPDAKRPDRRPGAPRGLRTPHDRPQTLRGTRTVGKLILIAGLTPVVVLLLVHLLPIIFRPERPHARTICANNLEILGLATSMWKSGIGWPMRASSPPHRQGLGSPSADRHLRIVQALLDAELIEDPDLLICPRSRQAPVERGTDGLLAPTLEHTSYEWNPAYLEGPVPEGVPVAWDRFVRELDESRGHEGGRNVLFESGRVRWMSSRDLEKRYPDLFGRE